MRFANIGFSFLILLFSSEICGYSPAWGVPWQIYRREALNLELPDDQATLRINKFNQKLTGIVPRLNPDQNWRIDIRYTNYRRSTRVKQALLRLEGYNLIFITEADAKAQGFSSVPALANTWAQSLSNLFKDPILRKLLIVGMGMPPQINYRGVTYYLKPVIAGDRGLFRTSGSRFMGRVIYWEVPADDKTYQIISTNKSLEPSSPPLSVFLLNRKLQFLTYTLEPS
ncbi:hypothetical protein Syn7502_02406 [Synechococcus sp. PCC 7502]|uniref:hypothetical protein n=1 Tax=Synechococcus sp. PCC 7502 TaxID=1173263 RepID=UPI00029FBD61|nr:hypothetical protein [Synechococcus sp. PCC 7502]AFY74391.1 hypothetical protein Syn7502_02406 [Synechococcus sp. PCC 7502]